MWNKNLNGDVDHCSVTVPFVERIQFILKTPAAPQEINNVHYLMEMLFSHKEAVEYVCGRPGAVS